MEIKVSEEAMRCIKETRTVDFLTEKWEKEWYALALLRATIWGNEVNKKGKTNPVKQLAKKYNTET